MPGFDFVIVGAGTAGCVLAARLSQDVNTHVLLIEAGGSKVLPAQTSPPAWPTLLQTPANWGDFTVEQSATGTSVQLPRGRGLGGSSAINGMVFARGHRTGYDRWPSQGAQGWGFDDLLPYFRRSETAVGRDPALRGIDGPLTVGPANPPHPVIEACLEAAAETGYARAADISGGLEEGFGLTDLNIVDGRRQSAADAYLAPALERPNLSVVTNALVRRLRISGGRCVGVEYRTGTDEVTVDCAGEVVLTAGAIGSAQLLLLSGVGPQAHLADVGLTTVLDLPGVGARLHDHPIVSITSSAARPLPPRRNNHGEAIGLIRSDPAVEEPDLQVVFVDLPSHLASGKDPEDGYTIAVSAIRPYSRGTLRLASNDPGAAPVLDPGFYTDERDLAAVVAGVRLVREIGHAPALAPWRGREVVPGPDADDDDAVRGFVRRTLTSYCHPVGTCRMGADPLSVTGPDLRVHGIDGLRVADASVFPSIPSANTVATVYAVAERAADLLRGTDSRRASS
ncbi:MULTISPECIES: GMC family oxidoreductase [Streptomyces]|uniref:GMC family oxidoreductase n=1 Tax=Streptomyces TaxID=1883 RepID=UPI0004CD6FE0|nr:MULTISPECIES: GMC family oxidoreductase N-terminal domain-containing protein [Streptomyces]